MVEVFADRGEIELRKPAASNSNNEDTNLERKVFAFDAVYDGRLVGCNGSRRSVLFQGVLMLINFLFQLRSDNPIR